MVKMAKVSVLGAGSWGIALARVLASNGHEVTVWSALKDEILMLKEHREHLQKLPGVKLSDSMIFTDCLKNAMEDKELLVLAVPSSFVRKTASQMKEFYKSGQVVVNVAKGIEEATLMTMSDVISDEIPNVRVAVLSGPSHAEEVGRGIPTTIVAGAKEKETAELVQNMFMNDVFRVYTSPDVIGIEIGAALKNVVALAAGIADGLGYGDNTKAALITRGMAEITRLGIAMGGEAETFYGLSGIGDLIVTCASMHSRNRRAGILIGQGKTAKQAMEEVGAVVEGYYAAKAAYALGQREGIDMPITEAAYKVLYEGADARETFQSLMIRRRKSESEDAGWL